MEYKELIENCIERFSSKDLKEAYKRDINIGVYPNWEIDDIISLLLYIDEWNIEKQIKSLVEVLKYVDDEKKKKQISEWVKELKHKGKKNNWNKKPKEFEKFVVVKSLFKAGDLIRFRGYKNKQRYGIVGNFNYDRVVGDITDVCYYSHTLDHNIDRNNLYEIYGCHDHPHKTIAERASEDELDEELKDYAKFLREKIVFADDKNVLKN